MTAMGRLGLKRLSLKKGDFELVLEREGNSVFLEEQSQSSLQPHLMGVPNSNIALSRGSGMPVAPISSPIMEEGSKEKIDVNSVYIPSPMVGTVYFSPAPDEPSFVKVGDKVEKNTVVCIIEAMKVMNEIKAGVSGTVAEVLLESGQPVEFATKIFRIVP